VRPAPGAALLLLCAACAGPQETVPRESVAAEVGEERIERLEALGYVGYSIEKADPDKQGAYVLDADRVQPGYSLYTSGTLCTADLIDLRGNVVRSWRDDPCEKWSHVELIAGGDVLIPGKDPQGRYLMRMGFDGAVVWKRRIAAHHDADMTPDGDLVALAVRDRHEPEYDPAAAIIDCEIVRLTPDGEPLETVSLYDVVAGDASHELIRVERRERAPRIDLFHCNSVEWVRRPDLAARDPRFRDELVLVSTRYQDRVYLIDWARRELAWSWGRGEISGPHDATLLGNGNVLLFDNGLERGWSRVVEVDPRTDEIVWSYGEPGAGSFFTEARGASQRLPNGNTLVSNSNSGHAFEVTPQGDVVWEFWNPRFNDEGHRAILVRMKRYPAETVGLPRP
jgi:hypothetical protein